MSENLLSPSTIKLYGRPFDDISINTKGLQTLREGGLKAADHQLLNRLLRDQVRDKDCEEADDDKDPEVLFARIYSFSY